MEYFLSKKMSSTERWREKIMTKQTKKWREEESAVWKIVLSRECEKWIHGCFWRSSDCGRRRRGRTDGPSDEQMGSQEEKAEVLI